MAGHEATGERSPRWRPGPGLVVAAAFLGPGTVTTAAVAGAQLGYALVWVVPLAVALALVLQEIAARPALVTGRDPAWLLARHGPGPGPVARGLAYGAVGAVVVGAAAFQAGNLAGASLGLEAVGGGPRSLWVVACADVAFVLLWFARYALIEKVLGTLVAVMGLAFVVDLAVVGVDWGLVARGLVPSLDGADLALVLALVGTTVVPYNLFLHGSALKAKRLTGRASLAPMRRDLAASLVVGGAVTAAVLMTSAAVLRGRSIESAGDMAAALGPLLGPVAEAAFGVGLFAAGLSSAVTAPLAAGLALRQLREGSLPARDERLPRVVPLAVLAVGTVVALVAVSPVRLIVAVQVANALILPLLALGFLVVVNRGVMGEDRAGWRTNAAGVAALLVTALLVLRLVV